MWSILVSVLRGHGKNIFLLPGSINASWSTLIDTDAQGNSIHSDILLLKLPLIKEAHGIPQVWQITYQLLFCMSVRFCFMCFIFPRQRFTHWELLRLLELTTLYVRIADIMCVSLWLWSFCLLRRHLCGTQLSHSPFESCCLVLFLCCFPFNV